MPLEVRPETIDTFKEKAAIVSAKVTEVADLGAALARIVEICETKKPCEMLLAEPGTELGPPSENNLPTRLRRAIAAPGLTDGDFAALETLAQAKGFLCLRGGLRNYLAGFDVGVAWADFGVAASGTCAVDSTADDVRLATMVCEDSVVLLRKSAIYPTLDDVAGLMREKQSSGQPHFHAFITGPSRTADIERVLTLGVHGPFELHIILLEG